MRLVQNIGLSDVQAVYSGAEGDLWELIMGQQIHIGGLTSSLDLAERAGIAAGSKGVDLCCCNGAGMRFLLRFRGVGHMTGVDATEAVLVRATERNRAEGFAAKTTLVRADVCRTGLPAGQADFVWGEDAWCYVVDKQALVAEAVRLVRPGGTIAFTDWVEGPGLSDADAARFMRFMKFPTFASVDDYTDLLRASGARVEVAEDTGRFAPYMDLYMDMLTKQLTSDALRIIGYDQALMGVLAGEMKFARGLARAGKIAQACMVARKPA